MTAPALRAERRRDGGTTTITLHGELDLATSPVLRSCLAEAATDPTPEVVVDLTGLSFLDSTGISVLVDAYNTHRRRGARLTAAHPTRAVRRVLEVAGLLDLFGVEEDPASAVPDDTGQDGDTAG